MGPLTLVRTSEAPGPVMKPLADPIPPEESRALANRLLEPYLHDPIENDDDDAQTGWPSPPWVSSTWIAHSSLLQNGKIPRHRSPLSSMSGYRLAARLAVKDPARAQAMVESITDLP